MTSESKKEKQTPSLSARMVNVMGGVKRIRKSGFNDFHKYAFATSEDVSDLIRELLSENGIAFLPSVDEIKQAPTPNGKGVITTVKFNMSLLCAESNEIFNANWYSESIDSSDKGINKACTAGVKYFLLKTFLVSSGDEIDPDEESPSISDTKPVEKITSAQLSMMQEIINKAGGDWSKFSTYCNDKFGSTPPNLDTSTAEAVLLNLEKHTRKAKQSNVDKIKEQLK